MEHLASMGNTISCLLDPDYQFQPDVLSYLKSQGLGLRVEDVPRTLYVELRQVPRILVELEASGSFDFPCGNPGSDHGTAFWHISNMTPEGMTLWFASSTGDGMIFILTHNIISIHTVSSKQIQETRYNAGPV